MTHPTDLTVAITSFKRPKYLERAIRSCVEAGLTRIVVFSMKPDAEVLAAINKFMGRTEMRLHSLPVDAGLHECWLRAAYHATTRYVIVLHDDDWFVPELGKVYEDVIYPMLASGKAGFASWRAWCVNDAGRVRPVEYWHGSTRIVKSSELEAFLLRPKRLSLSPVVSVFNRAVLLHALKEGHTVLTDHVHPGVVLGTEILAYLRHCSTFPTWLYVDKLLSNYGEHEGSGTIQYERSNNIGRLTKGYDQARSYYAARRLQPEIPEPRLLLTYAPYVPTNQADIDRILATHTSWQFHIHQGVINLSFTETEAARSSLDVGDTAWVPFLRDILDFGCAHALEEDVVAYTNLDIAFTSRMPEQVIAKAQEHGVCVVWRRTMPYDPAYLMKSCRNGLQDGGVDFVAVTPAWWREHREKIPDVLIGGDRWDYIFRTYAERVAGPSCYLADGCCHAPHPSFGSRNGHDTPRQKHNKVLALQFFTEIGDHQTAKLIGMGAR